MILATPWLHGIFTRRTLLLCAALAAVALIGGAGRTAASTAIHCNAPDPTGRLFCVTVEDLDGVSPSGVVGSGKTQVDVQAYHFYKFTIRNDGGSALTNGVATLQLSDTLSGGASVDSSALFVPSASAPFCRVVSTTPNVVRCTPPNIPAGVTGPTFVVGYRTSTSPSATATTASATVGFKEGAKSGANPATLTFDERTSLEPDPDQSVAWSPPGQNVSLGTSPTFDTQFSMLRYKVPADKQPFVATLAESDGYVCDPTLTCFGELVTTELPDPTAFSASNLFHLRFAISLDVVPGGSTNSFVVSHRLDDGSFEIISTRCSASPPKATDTVPCVIFTKDNKAKLLFVDIYAFENGGWMPG